MRRVLGALAPVLLASFLFAPAAHPQGGYLDLMARSLELLEARRFEDALSVIDEAVARHGDAQFLLLRGVALNRLRRPAAALIALRQAEAAGLRLPRLDLETGMAAVTLRSFELAQTRLERYEQARPGEARTALLRARAELGLGRLDEAERWYRETRNREPALEAHVLDGLARVAAARGDLPTAHAHRESLETIAAGSPLASALAQTLPAARSPWSGSVSFTPGYSDNVLLTPDGPALPTDVTDDDSVYWALAGNLAWRYALAPATAIVPAYSVQAGVYNDVGVANFLTNSVALTVEHGFAPGTDGGLTVSGQDTRVDHQGFSDGLGLDASLTHRAAPWLVLVAGYGLSATDYDDDPALGAAVRDGRRHAARLEGYVDLPPAGPFRPRLQAGARYTRNASNGSDFDFDGVGIDLGLSISMPWRLVLDVNAGFSRDDYDNPNSVAAAPGTPRFAFAREDRRASYRVQLSRPVRDGVLAFLTFEHTDNDSNIESFDYEQNIWNAGIRLRF